MKENWLTNRLDDVCRVEYGTRVVQKKDGGTIYPVYGGGGATFFMDSYNRENCLVIARFAMSAKCTRFVKDKFFLNDSGLTVSPKNDDEILVNFLNLQLLYLNDHIYSLSRGTAQRNLDVSAFRNIEINYPKSLKEQQHIVAVLDEVFSSIDKAKANIEKNIQNAKELFQSKLNAIFSQRGEGWKLYKMDDLCTIKSKLVDPRESLYSKKIHIGGGNIVSETGELIDLQTAEQEKLKSGKFLFDETMVLYNKIRPYLIKVARPDFSGLCSADMYPLSPKEAIISRDFLYYVLISKPFTDFAIEGSGRAGMPKVNRNHLFSYETVVPLVEVQNDITKKLDALREKCQSIENYYSIKLKELYELRNSLLHKAFSGELKLEKVDAV